MWNDANDDEDAKDFYFYFVDHLNNKKKYNVKFESQLIIGIISSTSNEK